MTVTATVKAIGDGERRNGHSAAAAIAAIIAVTMGVTVSVTTAVAATTAAAVAVAVAVAVAAAEAAVVLPSRALTLCLIAPHYCRCRL